MSVKRFPNQTAVKVIPLIILAAVVAALGVKMLVPSHAAPAGFIYRNGTQLMLDGKKYFSASIMSYTLTGCGSAGEVPTDTQIDQYMSMLPANSLIRTWAFRNMEGNLSKVISSAAAHNQKLILSFSDSGGGCGDPDGVKDANWYGGGYKTNYIPYVKRVVTAYKDSPAIGMWEIQNEESNDANLANFMEDTAKTIKSIDSNHLVESGTQPAWAYGGVSQWQAIQSGADIDVTSMHEYDYNAQNGAIVSAHFPGVATASKALNKPIIVGETGVWASASGCADPIAGQTPGPVSNFAQRANVIKQKFDQYYQQGAAVIMTFQVKYKTADCDLSMLPNDPTIAMIKSYVFPDGTPNDGGGAAVATPAPTVTPIVAPTDSPTPDSSGTVSYDDTLTGTGSNQFNYVGAGWGTSTDPAKFGGTDHYDSTAGDTMTFTFTGTKVSLYGAEA